MFAKTENICVAKYAIFFQVVEVGHFWGYRIDDKNMTLLKSLSAQISQLDLNPLSVQPYPDLVCLAPFTDWESEKYYRAQILFVSGKSADVCISSIV